MLSFEFNVKFKLQICNSGHLVAEFLLTARREAEDLLPDLARLHAEIDEDDRRGGADPAEHFPVHRHPERLEIAQLAVRAEHLLACRQAARRKARAHGALEAG